MTGDDERTGAPMCLGPASHGESNLGKHKYHNGENSDAYKYMKECVVVERFNHFTRMKVSSPSTILLFLHKAFHLHCFSISIQR